EFGGNTIIVIGIKSYANQISIAIIVPVPDKGVHCFGMFILTINPYINIFMVIENLHSGPRGRKYPFKGNYLGKLFGPVPFVPPYILVQFTIYPWPFPSQLRNIIFPFVGILERNYFLPF